MALTTPDGTFDEDDWSATRQVFARPELCALIAEHGDLLGAYRLRGVCRATKEGAAEWLRTLPGLVVCGGIQGGRVRGVWRLNLATLRWEPMPDLLSVRNGHMCCAVRGTIVVLGGITSEDGVAGNSVTSSVEMLSEEQGAFMSLPSLSCGGIRGASAIAVDESESALGQVLLLGGVRQGIASEVHLVDLATGTCTRQPHMLHARCNFAAARLKDGRVVRAGGGPHPSSISAEVYGPPVQGAPDAPWTWTELPSMSVGRYGCSGCVMSDGRFAVLDGETSSYSSSSCEALVVGDDAHWAPLSPMHEPRRYVACAAVAGCVIVAGGVGRKTAEVYDEVLDRWFRLPRDLPHALAWMGSALL
jgi:hypothetical protein